MSDELTPVFLSERMGQVSVLPLLGTGEKLALYEEDRYRVIGQVHETRNRNAKLVWSWYYDEPEWGRAQGEAPTKSGAVAALLKEGGYRVADENAITPHLF